METPPDVGSQGILHVLVGQRKVKPVRVEVTVTPAFHIGVLWILPVDHGCQEPFVAADTTDILRRARADSRDAGADPGNDVQSERLFDLGGMTPAVAEIVEIVERRTAVGIKQAHLALVEDAGAIRKIILLQKLWVAIAQATDIEFVQMAVPPVEGGLDYTMELAQMPGSGNDEPAPDRRLDLGQCYPDLHRIGLLIEHRQRSFAQ